MYKAQQPPSVSVVIPTLNEAKNLPHVLPHLPNIVSEVILVDGGSRDNTIQVAKELRPDIIVIRDSGKVKGNAFTEGGLAIVASIYWPMRASRFSLLISAMATTPSGDIVSPTWILIVRASRSKLL